MIHIVRRDDHSVVKVRQDGEVVLITANERAYLNEIGNQIEEFGTKDYDYFFELFGVPNERRAGVYTANLDQGKLWTQDEEGNYFIVYANGDSVEKMSVSFNLDQMVEGIDNKEADSPRIRDGEYIEEECKFLPPPKSMAHPRLFFVRADGSGIEFFNKEQLMHMFRTYDKLKQDPDLIQSANKVQDSNETSISHVFIDKQHQSFNAQAFDVSAEFPKLPQTLELVNQTVSIPTEPVVEHYTYKNVLEFHEMDEERMQEFERALATYHAQEDKQGARAAELQIRDPHIITKAAPPMGEREARMRSTHLTGMGSTIAASMHSPRSEANDTTFLNKSLDSHARQPKASGRATEELERSMAEAVAAKAAEQAAEKLNEEMLAQDDIPIDETSGLHLYSHQLELTVM